MLLLRSFRQVPLCSSQPPHQIASSTKPSPHLIPSQSGRPASSRWPSVCEKRFHMMDRLGYGCSTFGPRRMRNATRANNQKSPLFSLAGFAATPTTPTLYFQPPHSDFCSQSVSNARAKLSSTKSARRQKSQSATTRHQLGRHAQEFPRANQPPRG